MKKEKLRLFIAIDIGDNVRSNIASELKDISALSPKIKTVKPESIHLTIKFLGSTDSGTVPSIIDCLNNALSDSEPFNLEAKGIGAFPNSKKPRVIWAGLTDENKDNLQRLFEAIEEKMVGLNFDEEKRQFNPHLTIARIKFPEKNSIIKDYIEENAECLFGTINVKSVKLIKSTLLPAGAQYDCIREFPLEEKSL